jgi:hypothetical protein
MIACQRRNLIIKADGAALSDGAIAENVRPILQVVPLTPLSRRSLSHPMIGPSLKHRAGSPVIEAIGFCTENGQVCLSRAAIA